MKIIYLGNFYSPKAYEELLAPSQSQLNPSGQNFHALLAKALALNFETSVISFSPPPSEEDKTQNPTYHYLGEEKNGFSLIKKSLQKVLEIKDNDGICVFFDALNLKAAKVAKILRTEYIVRTVGVITDKADNISKTFPFYPSLVRSYLYCPDAYICVTKGLNDYYNTKRKPYLILPGIIDHRPIRKAPYEEGSYIFFGGALSERFGALNLIRAFKKLQSSYHLVVAGHRPDKQLLSEMEGIEKIHFLGLISPRLFHDYASQSALNVNPRPYDRKLDPYCVPSKLVEFLSVPVPVLSGECGPLRKTFEEDVNWLSDVSEEGLRRYLQKHIGKKGTFVRLIQNEGMAEIKRATALVNVAKNLQSFLEDLSKTFSN